LVAPADWKSAIQQTGSLRYAVRSAELVEYPGQAFVWNGEILFPVLALALGAAYIWLSS